MFSNAGVSFLQPCRFQPKFILCKILCSYNYYSNLQYSPHDACQFCFTIYSTKRAIELFCSSTEASFFGLVVRPRVNHRIPHREGFLSNCSEAGLFCSMHAIVGWGCFAVMCWNWSQQFCVKPFVGPCQSYMLLIQAHIVRREKRWSCVQGCLCHFVQFYVTKTVLRCYALGILYITCACTRDVLYCTEARLKHEGVILATNCTFYYLIVTAHNRNSSYGQPLETGSFLLKIYRFRQLRSTLMSWEQKRGRTWRQNSRKTK